MRMIFTDDHKIYRLRLSHAVLHLHGGTKTYTK